MKKHTGFAVFVWGWIIIIVAVITSFGAFRKSLTDGKMVTNERKIRTVYADQTAYRKQSNFGFYAMITLLIAVGLVIWLVIIPSLS